MEEIYTLENLTPREIRAMRQGLNSISITGIDAMFVASLQVKIDEQIKQIENHIQKSSLPPIANTQDKKPVKSKK